MKKNNKTSFLFIAAIFSVFGLAGPSVAFAAGPAAVDLLSAGNFIIVSKTGITNTGSHTSAITGNIGSSPITSSAMDNVFCSEVTGTIYGVDAAYVGSGNQTCFAGNPPLSNKTTIDNAVLDMGTAYTDAAGRTLPDGTELYAGNIGGQTFAPGLYKWSTAVTASSDVTLSGGASDVWIFQIAGDLNVASAGSTATGVKIILSGGAQASNVFWQVGGLTGATLGTYSTFNGNILSSKQVVAQTGAILTGRALAQTQVTLDANTISSVAPSVPTPPTPPVTPSNTNSGRTRSSSRSGSQSNSTTTITTTTTNTTAPLSTSTAIFASSAPMAPLYYFPNAGLAPQETANSWNIAVFSAVLCLGFVAFAVILRKRAV